ncbi:META domain-containing protein [Subsaxibacter sp. CAU 1640]|uniref:META domain-containing protein n=1 Tax=Subsaxibacter sp. CAU 1640 TaxID=2933271 RepID=UPI0020035026|nr:META domain-containing protein [Subsaxibacter sp. CAU 1640]MCK7591456.1 META domain-containing protein [Subsaxibacter sp. CAU 1640]
MANAKVAAEKSQPTDVYFKATGTEPFWSVTISEEMIKFKTPEDSVMTPHTTPARAQDSNVKRYTVQTESASMTIQIRQMECTNAMSGEVSPYTVELELKKGSASEYSSYKGCGAYVTDYRLHDIWVLESMNGIDVGREDFGKEVPSMEIKAAENTFMGNAGCNRMSGSLFFEKGLLRFTNIATTKMLCQSPNKENEFLSTLRAMTSYTVENNRLLLTNPNNQSLVFKKVD